MKKLAKIMLITVCACICLLTTVYATESEQSQEVLQGKSTGKLLEMNIHETKTLEEFKEKYGSDTYGVTAYILNKVQIFSVPLVFIGIAFSAIYQYVIGIKKLDVRDKGFNSMIAIITIGVICQVLPLVFSIVVSSAERQ